MVFYFRSLVVIYYVKSLLFYQDGYDLKKNADLI